MVATHLNTNYIFVKLMRNRLNEEMIRTYENIINRMRVVWLGLIKHILINEASNTFKQCIQEHNMKYELIPPGNQSRNHAEHAIQAFKVHFILILAGDDDKSPLSLWWHLSKPTEFALNLLHQSNVAPTISAFTHVHRPHYYMKKPFMLLFCAIQAHIKLENPHTWDTHLDSSFNLGMPMEHHCCLQVYITKTWVTRISNMVFFKHQYMTKFTLNLTLLQQSSNLQPLSKTISRRDTKWQRHKQSSANSSPN